MAQRKLTAHGYSRIIRPICPIHQIRDKHPVTFLFKDDSDIDIPL